MRITVALSSVKNVSPTAPLSFFPESTESSSEQFLMAENKTVKLQAVRLRAIQ